MPDLSATFPLLVEDEFRLLQELVGLSGRDILDVGCGTAAMSARMASEGGARKVIGLEVDERQLEKNRARSWPAGVEFQQCGAEALPFGAASIDGITLFKSLHHVPVAAMDEAFREMQRVLRPGGWLFISEPVYEGPFNDIVRMFHDEGVVRREAIQATGRAVERGLFHHARRVQFMAPVTFSDFEDFRRRLMQPTHSQFAISPALEEAVRGAFEAHQTPGGAHFLRPMRVDLLLKP
ncbi:class I SAM-dependent methyltransferase [Ramlibacter monticola]|uniref:Class I SAM-dependent methyltransferase n=1 Tax=Ramlibacter monticola TaxID=1926872 RepID=A0A936Z492_9BURK|nr:class I SAM-dependent methyltransferase [Ramlibacter monticola]MBL0393340.1 class I SAM-dependent methyltransferase [Ramlibacter monticola]